MQTLFASETRSRAIVVIVAALVLSFAWGHASIAQVTRSGQSRSSAAGDQIIEMNLSGNVKVTALLDLMSRELGIRFLHSVDIARREVTVYTPARMPKKVLPELLGTLLREAGLAIVDSDVAGWKRVVDIADIVSNAPAGDASEIGKRNGPAAAVTQVLSVKYIDVTTASTSLKSFLSKTGSNVVAIPNQKVLIISGYAADVKLVADLLALIDRPEEGVIEFYEARRRRPKLLIEQYESLKKSDAPKKATSGGPTLLTDKSGQRVVIAGRKEQVRAAIELLRQLDSGSEFLTRVYRLEYVGADRLDNLIQGFVDRPDGEGTRRVETTVDNDGNLLVVRGGAEIHRQIETLIAELDQPVDSDESPIRFYKLKNATAIEVLYSLLALQQAAGTGVSQAGGLGAGAFGTLGGANVGGVFPGMGLGGQLGNAGFGNTSQVGLPLGNAAQGGIRNAGLQTLGGSNLGNNLERNRNGNQNAALGSLGGGFGGAGFGGGAGASVATLPGGARVSADQATNSLIVFAPSNVQSLYEKLIKSLDQRRPQVLIQADIIAIDTSDNFSLGVEISGGDRSGAKKLFKFTSFGLSEIDATTGALTVNPSLGFNGVVIDPEIADVVVQALSRHTRGRVLSSPKILVNDNQTGTLNSVSSVPFESVNAADTIATTSLGGNQEAGTSIDVTPHINEDNHLQLEFAVEFSTFVGAASGNLPPPRQIDRVESVVTIPDGKTVVVGGLKRTSDGDSFTGVPWLEKIPVLRELSSLRAKEGSTTSFFLFIRPRILRDSEFRDLKFLSDIESQDAELSPDFPVSRPLLVPCPVPPDATQTLRPNRASQDMSHIGGEWGTDYLGDGETVVEQYRVDEHYPMNDGFPQAEFQVIE